MAIKFEKYPRAKVCPTKAKNKIFFVSPYATDPKKKPHPEKGFHDLDFFFRQNLYFRAFF